MSVRADCVEDVFLHQIVLISVHFALFQLAPDLALSLEQRRIDFGVVSVGVQQLVHDSQIFKRFDFFLFNDSAACLQPTPAFHPAVAGLRIDIDVDSGI